MFIKAFSTCVIVEPMLPRPVFVNSPESSRIALPTSS
jgi:hypothetical protein